MKQITSPMVVCALFLLVLARRALMSLIDHLDEELGRDGGVDEGLVGRADLGGVDVEPGLEAGSRPLVDGDAVVVLVKTTVVS
jgi:hypothetical protein